MIGPYKAGLLQRFDADSAVDRKRAEAFGFSAETCDLCLRVTQGAGTRTYLLAANVDPRADPLKSGSFATTAINLPVSDGPITRIELLHVPDVMRCGLDACSTLLHARTAGPALATAAP